LDVGTAPGDACPNYDANTLTCLSAAWNSNNPFSSGTGGICFSAGAFYGAGANGSVCLVWNNHQVGVTLGGGPGIGAGGGFAFGVESSNATCIASLGKWFTEEGGSVGLASVTHSSGGKTTVVFYGIGPYGFEGNVSKTYTWTFTF